MAGALGMLATAASPVGMGWLIDAGVSLEAIMRRCLMLLSGAVILARAVSRTASVR